MRALEEGCLPLALGIAQEMGSLAPAAVQLALKLRHVVWRHGFVRPVRRTLYFKDTVVANKAVGRSCQPCMCLMNEEACAHHLRPKLGCVKVPGCVLQCIAAPCVIVPFPALVPAPDAARRVLPERPRCAVGIDSRDCPEVAADGPMRHGSVKRCLYRKEGEACY